MSSNVFECLQMSSIVPECLRMSQKGSEGLSGLGLNRILSKLKTIVFRFNLELETLKIKRYWLLLNKATNKRERAYRKFLGSLAYRCLFPKALIGGPPPPQHGTFVQKSCHFGIISFSHLEDFKRHQQLRCGAKDTRICA